MNKKDIKLRTHKDLIKYLERDYYVAEYEKTDGYLYIGIEDGIHFDGVTMLPPKVIFGNEGDLVFDSLVVLPRLCVFKNCESGDVIFDKLKNMPGETIFKNGGDVIFSVLDRVPGGVVFENYGDVDFYSPIMHFGNRVTFCNACDVNIIKTPVLNKFIEFNNEGDVGIDKVSRIAHNYHFNNGDDVEISVESMGEAVVFNNDGNVEISGLKTLPKRTGFCSESVELLDVTEIKSRCAFKGCYSLRMPSFKGFPKGVQFDVSEMIHIDHIDYIARDVKFEHFEKRGGRYVLHLSGGGFNDSVAVFANSLSESIEHRIEMSFYDYEVDDEVEEGEKEFDEYINGRIITEKICLSYIDVTEWGFFSFFDIPKKFRTRKVWLKGVEKSLDVLEGLPQKYVNDMEFLKVIARNCEHGDELYGFKIKYEYRVIELYSQVKPSVIASFYDRFPVRSPTQEFWMQLVGCCGEALEVVPENLIDNDMINYVVEHSLEASLPFIPVGLLTQEIILAAVKLNGLLLKHIPDNMINEMYCDVAINNDALALEFVPDDLKSSELVEKAIVKNGLAYKFKPTDMSISTSASQYAKYTNLKHLKWEDVYKMYLDYTNKKIPVSDIILKYNLDSPNNKLIQLFPEIIKSTDICFNCSNNIYVKTTGQDTSLWCREYLCMNCGPFTYVIYRSGTKPWSKDMVL
jgi:hypothetical protein